VSTGNETPLPGLPGFRFFLRHGLGIESPKKQTKTPKMPTSKKIRTGMAPCTDASSIRLIF
jgi:hypothetical protein